MDTETTPLPPVRTDQAMKLPHNPISAATRWLTSHLTATGPSVLPLASLAMRFTPKSMVSARIAAAVLSCCFALSTQAAPKVLVAASSSYKQDVVTKLQATGRYDSVGLFDTASGTPTLTQMQAYDAVFVFSDSGHSNPTLLGDNLANYVDGGGGVVLGVFTVGSVPVSGRLLSGGYLPYSGGGQGSNGNQTLTPVIPGHQLLAGVNSFNGGTSGYYGTVSLAAGATLVANWSGGAPLVMFKKISITPVVALNFYPPSSTIRSDFWTASTDGVRLMTNAVEFVGPTTTTNAATAISTTSATLNGTVNPKGLASTAWFEWGTSPTLVGATSTTSVAAGSGSSDVAINHPLTNLTADTTYYFRVVMNNSAGTWPGSILSFFTGAEIAVEQPVGTNLVDGAATVAFNDVLISTASAAKTFTIKNSGSLPLTGLAITGDGANSADFTASALGSTTVAPGGSTTFTVTVTPSALGARSAALHIASNDSNENPFDINLTANGVATLPLPAYTFTNSTNPQTFSGYTFGSRFTVNTACSVSSLGFYDHNQDGISGNVQVGLWNSAGTLLASTTVSNANPLVGVFRYSDITPVPLTVGQSYVVGALTNGVDQSAINMPSFVVDSRITYDESRYNGANGFNFPQNSNGNTPLMSAGMRLSAAAPTNAAPTDIALSATSVGENQPSGTTVATITGTDPDAGQSATLTFSLVSGTGSTDNASFSIAGTSLKTAAAFNFETKSSYSIRLRATDSGSPGLTYEEAFTISVTNVNEAPTDITLTSATIPENSAANTTVGSLAAVDEDAADSHSFSLVSGTGDADNVSFTITGSTLKLTTSANFEIKSSYALCVQATDALGATFARALTVTITNVNEVATDIALTPAVIPENNVANTTVSVLAALDEDEADSHSFSLVSGAGDADNASFTIDGTALKLTPSANFEIKSSYALRVQATDALGATFARALTVTITNVNEVATDIALTPAVIPENSAANTTVGLLVAVDEDAADSNSLSLVAGDGDTNNADFTIDGTALKLTPSANFETQSSYSVRVQATDAHGAIFAKPITVSISDVNEMPSFAKGADQSLPALIMVPQSIPGWATAINDGDSSATQTLTFNVSVTSGAALFTTAPAISADGTLTYKLGGAVGTAVISVTLTDDASINRTAALTTGAQTFSITSQEAASTGHVFDDSTGISSGGFIYRPIPGVINNASQISFKAMGQVGTGGFTSGNDSILITNVSGDFQVIGQEATAAPGGGSLSGTFNNLVLSAGGQTVASERFLGALTTSDNGYVVSGDGLSLELMSREGDTATEGGIFTGHTGRHAADDEERIYFPGTLSGVPTTKNSGTWYDEAGTIAVLAKEGDDVGPVTGDLAWLGNFSAPLSAAGEGAAFVAALQNNPDNATQKTPVAKNAAIFSGAPESLELVARKGDLIPTVGKLGSFSAVSRGGNGDHAFISLLTLSTAAPVVAAANDQVIMAEIGGVKHLVARENITDLVGSLKPVRFGSFYMTDAGEVIYQAWLIGTGVTTANDFVLCRWTVAGSNEVLAREGDSAPGTGSHYQAFQGFSVSSGGAVVLQSTLGNGKIALMRAMPGAGLTSAVQTGTTLTYDGATRSILSFGIHQTGTGAGGGGGGLGAAINDEGAIFTVLSIGASEYVTRVYRP